METVVHLAIIPDENAKLTPLELLEDFADASLGWSYLEAESEHYAQEKDCPACVLRHRRDDELGHVDLAFATPDPGNSHDVELIILDVPRPEYELTLDERNDVVDAFIRHFREYLQGRPGHASLRVAKDDIDPSASPTPS